MGYVNQDDLIRCRKAIAEHTTKGDTFLGLLLYYINIENWLIPSRYAKADMRKFSELADKAFGVIEPETSYAEKKWFALFSDSWIKDISNFYLKGQKIPALEACVTIFWWMEFDSEKGAISFFKEKFPIEIFSMFFHEKISHTIKFDNDSACERSKLLTALGGGEYQAVKIDGTLIKKRAGELSGAPFSQTLYAASEIKHFVNVTDFNLLDNFKLLLNKNSAKENIEPITKNTYQTTALSKPFLLLAGISGTGKTRFVRKQAESNGDLASSYCLTAVRPDWHEPSDLLGYVSRLSGKSEYVVTDVLKFIVKSWLEIEQSGITLTKNSVTGSQAQQQQVKPFWLCLDEMNLAPVEQYFADYLSVLETREWLWNDEEFTYQCDPLLKPSIFDDIEQDKLKKELGLEGHDDLWQHFLENGISIPFNLIVAGTVNMDETTHGFSRKVIDRALTFDFGEFFPNDFKEFFDPTNTPEILGYPVLTDGRDKAALSTTFDSDGNLSIKLLGSINLVLTNTPFKLAYRALNELLLSVISHKPKTEIELAAVWDDFLMCKVLPRIEGDIDKLTKGGEDKNILEQLDTLLSDQLKTIWDGKVRPDLFRKSLENDQPIAIECRAKAKLDWMHAQLENGFTSFWP